MKFDEAYEKVLNGTATEEEREYVREQVRKAEQIDSILKNEDRAPVTKNVDTETVKKARKQFTVKGALIVIMIVMLCMIIVAGAVCGGVFGTAVSSAKKADLVSAEEARLIAENTAVKRVSESETGTLTPDVVDIDKELEIAPKLTDSVYVYSFDIKIMADRWIYEIEVEVNAQTGYAAITDFDRG